MTRRAVIAGVGHTDFGKLEGTHRVASRGARPRRPRWRMPACLPRTWTDCSPIPGPAQGILDGITPHFLRWARSWASTPTTRDRRSSGARGASPSWTRAALAVEAGLCDVCLCVYGDSPLSSPGSFQYGRGDEAAFGFFGAVGLHALAARRHMHRTARVPSTSGRWPWPRGPTRPGHRTPRSAEPISMDDYLASELLVEPLRKLDCCLVSDGAAAVLVTTRSAPVDLRVRCHPDPRPRAGPQPVHVRLTPAHFDTLPAARCGPKALARAGLTPADVDVALLYDCFTIVVLLQLEDYGFCKKGESGPFVEGGRIGPGGSLPVNPSGGLLAEGYGSGMLHVIEAVRQLRGGGRGAPGADAETALVSGHGLGMNTHATLVLGS